MRQRHVTPVRLWVALTSVLPSTQSRIHPLKPAPPTLLAKPSISFGQYPIVASGVRSASEASSHTRSELWVGDDGVCGYDPCMSARDMLRVALVTHQTRKEQRLARAGL